MSRCTAADGLHVRLRSSKTDQEGAGTVRALPYGKDPATCPPCALIRWRRILLAYDAGKRPAALSAVHHRGPATEHVCRDADITVDAAARMTRRWGSGGCSRRCTAPGNPARRR